MSYTTVPQLTLPENRPTRLVTHPSGYVLRTAPYDAFDTGPWGWRPVENYRRDLRTGRHRRGEAPDTFVPADPFTKLREDAWTRFLTESEVLAQAHTARRRPSRLRALATTLRNAARRITHLRRDPESC